MILKLILRNLGAHPWRTLLTTGSVFLAVFLVCFLRATVSTLTSSIEQASTQRLWVQSAVSLFVDLPLAYENKLRGVDGVEWVSKWQWFGGVYQDDSNFFAQFGVDHDTLLKSYPEMTIVAGDYEKFSANRTGCIIGKDIADKYGFEVGGTLPIIGRIFARKDGKPWEFKVEAVYETSTAAVDQNTLYFHFDYLKEAIEAGATSGEVAVGVYMLKVKDGTDPTPIMSAVDLLFENGPQKVQTTTEAEFGRQFISMLGNVPLLLQAIGGAVLFAIFFAVLNTMMMAGHERTRDFGVMKALGFSDGIILRSLITESLLLTMFGGLLGIGLAKALESILQRTMANMLPGFYVSLGTLLIGLGIAAGIGLLAGILPGVRAQRLAPVAALREEG